MNILLMGPQGSGKGTLGNKIARDFGLVPVSTGDLFRQSIAKGEKLGLEAKTYMDKGLLVPIELTLGILADRLKQPDCKKGVMFDGFPRSIEQAEALAKIATVDHVILLDVPKEVCIQRMIGRRVCSKCGAIFNVETYKNTECDKCGGKLVQRDDDKLDAIKTRLEVYEKTTAPLIDFYA
ncbi:MAG: nucleoside monophosphate kinase, partial [Clostridia bacterium]|nr:nucleoside monophosphate kinase [Clostridia bacterium]